MFSRPSITQEKLRALLLARYNATTTKKRKIQDRIEQLIAGDNVRISSSNNSRVVIVEKKIADWVTDLLACRLMQDRRTTPLLTLEDFSQFVSTLAEEVAQVNVDEFTEKEKALYEKFMHQIFEFIVEAINADFSSKRNSYDEYWRWVATILEISAEKDVPPEQLLLLEETGDEITRRMLTKEEFIALSREYTRKFVDIDFVRKSIIQALISFCASEMSAEEAEQLEQEVIKEITPYLVEVLEKVKILVETLLAEEVSRIYKETLVT